MSWYQNWGGTTYSYDANGNTTVISARQGVTTQTWDAEDRLIGVQLPTSVGGANLGYQYRYDGLLSQKQGPRGQENLIWDGDSPLVWTNTTAGLNQLYVTGKYRGRC